MYKFGVAKKIGNEVYIVAAKRTPIGSFMGKLSGFTAPQLGGIAIKAAMNSIKLNQQDVDEVIMGNVLSAGLGQAPARQACIKAGLGVQVTCTTINKMCASGMKSIVYGAQSIALEDSHTVITGGFQCMSRAPHLIHARKGLGYGDQRLIDSMSFDGLTDPFNRISMGLCAEKTVNDFKLTRQAQDQYCKLSYKRHFQASNQGFYKNEITNVFIDMKGKQIQFSQDEQKNVYKEEKVSLLKPAFSKTGTITPANASKINDAGSAIILMSKSKLQSLKIKPLAKIISYADAEVQPIDFSISPNYSVKKVLKKANMELSDISFFQFNQAFSSVALVNMKLLDLTEKKVNLYGGAVSMGHPIGMSGARIVQSLITVLKNNKAKYGLAAICNGGGGSTAMIIENLQ